MTGKRASADMTREEDLLLIFSFNYEQNPSPPDGDYGQSCDDRTRNFASRFEKLQILNSISSCKFSLERSMHHHLTLATESMAVTTDKVGMSTIAYRHRENDRTIGRKEQNDHGK